jgi:hypothetical protein
MCSSRKRRRFFSDIKTYDDSYVSMGTNFSFMCQETRLCHSFGVLQDEWQWHCGALACCRFVGWGPILSRLWKRREWDRLNILLWVGDTIVAKGDSGWIHDVLLQRPCLESGMSISVTAVKKMGTGSSQHPSFFRRYHRCKRRFGMNSWSIITTSLCTKRW